MKLFLSRKWGCLMLLPLAASLYAQKDLKTRATQVGIDERGYYQSIQVNGEQILGGKQFPVISAGSQGKVILPASMKASEVYDDRRKPGDAPGKGIGRLYPAGSGGSAREI